jgi:hypothetical protein
MPQLLRRVQVASQGGHAKPQVAFQGHQERKSRRNHSYRDSGGFSVSGSSGLDVRRKGCCVQPVRL